MKQLAQEIKARGLIEQQGGGTLEEILGKKRAVYLGIDPSADSLHVGNLVSVIVMKHLINAGHEPYFIVGGGTGLIGDPRESGERTLQDEKVVEANAKAIKEQLKKILGKGSFTMLDNALWLKKLSAIEFLRDIGKHFTVNQLIKKEIIKKRLQNEEDSISYTEFSYSLLQGYDYLHLNEKYGVDLQVGGSDQWTNILAGVDLIRKKRNRPSYALTTPIIVDRTTGKKFGKSEGNAIWLDAKKTSPFSFYQFWLNCADENVFEYLKIFTFLPLSALEKMKEEQSVSPQIRVAQKTLAREVTALIHGENVAKEIENVSEILYGENVTRLSSKECALIIKNVPTTTFTKKELTEGVSIVDALVASGLATSKTDARRLVEGKAVSLDGVGILSLDFLFTHNALKGGLALIRKGKKVAGVSLKG